MAARQGPYTSHAASSRLSAAGITHVQRDFFRDPFGERLHDGCDGYREASAQAAVGSLDGVDEQLSGQAVHSSRASSTASPSPSPWELVALPVCDSCPPSSFRRCSRPGCPGPAEAAPTARDVRSRDRAPATSVNGVRPIRFSPDECYFRCDKQDPGLAPSSQVSGTHCLFDQASDTLHTKARS